MKKTKIAILGYGSRGSLYAKFVEQNADRMELVAVCDIDSQRCEKARKQFRLPENRVFSDYLDLYRCGKIADVMVVATQDGDHKKHILPALKLGYDVLLEKPIATSIEDCREIIRTAERCGNKIAVAYVLRYTPFYQKIKQIVSSGTIGEVVTVNQTENVGYWHQAHSFVRGNWRKESETSPMILQKCCHDFDIIKWLIDKRCLKISSFGSLSYFTPSHKPAQSADYCVDCAADCAYNCFDFYKTHPDWLAMISQNRDPNAVLSDKRSPYARCVFRCDNDVVDHQVVNMLFEEGVTAHLTMTAFSKDCRRCIKIHGTEGEIIGDIEEERVEVTQFQHGGICERSEVFYLNEGANRIEGHGGGDQRFFEDFIARVAEGGNHGGLTDIRHSIESHEMAFQAEYSRRNSGEVRTIALDCDSSAADSERNGAERRIPRSTDTVPSRAEKRAENITEFTIR